MLLKALETCRGDNAQGELYLTDTLEFLAARARVRLLEINRSIDMLTFNTKKELRTVGRILLPRASGLLAALKNGEWQERLEAVYGSNAENQRCRYMQLVEAFIARYGDHEAVITRSPGRVNLMGRHIDHRGGMTNVMTIDRDVVMVVSPRQDDIVRIANLDSA